MSPLRATMVFSCLLFGIATFVSASVAALEAPRAPNLAFEENRGQVDSSIRYLSRAEQMLLLFRADGLVISSTQQSAPIHMRFAGSTLRARVVGEKQLASTVNYLYGNEPSGWHSNIPMFAQITYQHIYSGVDVRFYGNGGGLEYDFVVAPHADVRQIAWQFSAGSEPRIDPAGALVIKSGAHEFRHPKPVAYQIVNGSRVPVDVAYDFRGPSLIGFSIGQYDPAYMLTLDPVIAYSSFFGGAGDDEARAIAVQSLPSEPDNPVKQTAVYVAGTTASSTIANVTLNPVTAGEDSEHHTLRTSRGASDAFVTKFIMQTDGSVSVAYTTYLGCPATASVPSSHCSAENIANAIALTPNGQVVLAGTSLGGFPRTKDSFAHAWSGSDRDAFVAKLSSDGSALEYSLLIGGSGRDEGTGVLVDVNGAVTVIGVTSPLAGGSQYDLPISGSTTCSDTLRDSSGNLRPTLLGIPRSLKEAFIVRIAADGKCPIYTKYLGGAGDDIPYAIADDGAGGAFVAGGTPSAGTCFLIHIDPNGDLVKSTVLNGAAFFALYRYGDRLYLGGGTGRVSIFNTELVNLSNLTVANGNVNGVAHDSYGNIWVAGTTYSGITTPKAAEQRSRASANDAAGEARTDAFIAKLGVTDVDGTPTPRVRYSSYLGGQDADSANAIAVDDQGYAYIVGTTSSTDFPRTQRALQPAIGGGKDAFLRRTTGDIDEDGIPDTWETAGEGIDLNRDGEIELDLAALGATPTRKDVFLEVDYLEQKTAEGTLKAHTHRPTFRPDAVNSEQSGSLPNELLPIKRVIDAFSNSPVTPPADCSDCTGGIGLHTRGANNDGTDDAIPETAANRLLNGPNGLAGSMLKFGAAEEPWPVPCAGYFLTRADRSDPDKCPLLRDAWLQVAHWIVFGHRVQDRDGNEVFGLGESYGNDIIIGIHEGEKRNPIEGLVSQFSADQKYAGTAFDRTDLVWSDIRAYNLMHELGHNLGLGHGGGRGLTGTDSGGQLVNCKPNYMSVMNYVYANPLLAFPAQLAAPARLGRTKLDYSHGTLPVLDENGLSEQVSLGGPAGLDVMFSARLVPNGQYWYPFQVEADAPKIDWSTGRTTYNTALCNDCDINRPLGVDDCDKPTPGQLLKDHDDWSNLYYEFPANSAAFGTVFARNDALPPEPSDETLYYSNPIAPGFSALNVVAECASVAPQTLAFESSIDDLDNNVASVEYFVNDSSIGISAVPPYRVLWNVLQPGQYTYSAKVTDADGWSRETEPQTYTVGGGSAPSLAITAPASGSAHTEGTPIAFSVDALDADGCIGTVEFYANDTKIGNGQNYFLQSGRWLVQFNWNGAAVGTYAITARLRQGLTYSSAPIEVRVDPNSSPVAHILSPAHGSVFRAPTDLAISAEAFDNDGYVTKVEFFADSQKLGEMAYPTSQYTYTLPWNAVPLGTHHLTIKATDNVGAITESAPVAISVVTNIPPAVHFTSPSTGTEYRAPLWVVGTFEMSDVDGSVVKTEFFVNGELEWMLPYPQSSFQFKATEPGTYTFTVGATDNEGAITLSSPIEVHVLPSCAAPSFAGLDTISTSEDSIHLAWTAATPSCGDYPIFYNIYRSEDPTFEPTDESWWDCRVSGTSFDETYGVVPGVTYYYIVRAIHSDSMGCFRSSEDANLVRMSARIEPQAVLVGFNVTPTSVIGGTHIQATVTIDYPAPVGGATIMLHSPSPSVVVPDSVSIAEGATTAAFEITTLPVAAVTAVDLTATYGAQVPASVTIQPPHVVSLALTPTAVIGGQSSSATITLDGPAPEAFDVEMSSSNASVSVAATLRIPPAAIEANLPLTTSVVSSDTDVVITARRDATERTAVLTVRTATVSIPDIASLSVSPDTVVPGIATVSGTVTLVSAAPTALDVALQSSRTDLATVPASVHFTQGMTSASFPVTLMHGVAEATSVTLTASLSNSVSASLRLDPPIAESIEIAAEVPSSSQIPFVVHVNGLVVPGGTLTLTSTSPNVANPSMATQSGTIYAGVLTTGIVSVPTTVVLSVTSGDATVSKTVTVAACAPQPNSPSIPQEDSVWFEDSYGELSTVDEGDPGIWDTSQHATGSASLKLSLAEGWRDSFVYLDSVLPEVGADQTLVAYVLINECGVPPKTLSIAIDTPYVFRCCGRPRPPSVYVLYWGDRAPMEVEVFVGTAATIRVGDLPAAGQWTRLEVPLAMVYGGPVTWLAFRAYDGEVWWDHIGVAPGPAPARIGDALLPDSPQVAGTTLSWEITAHGGAPPIEYQFERYDGSIWTVVQSYSTTNVYAWTPAVEDVGDHRIRVSVRNTGSTSVEDARTYPFVVSPP